MVTGVGLIATLMIGAPIAPPPVERPDGRRVELTHGQLFVPSGYRANGGKVHLVLHLHVSVGYAERNLMLADKDAVLVTVVLPGLSDVYSELFRDPTALRTILTEVPEKLKELNATCMDAVVADLTITSFSAGFGGVREILRDPELYETVDTLIMADSIHARLAEGDGPRAAEPEDLEGFRQFAEDAAAGRKRMLITHSEIQPETYASTTETTRYLLECVGGAPEPVDETWVDAWHCTSRCKVGDLLVYGFTGTTGIEHMQHLWHTWALMRQVDADGALGPDEFGVVSWAAANGCAHLLHGLSPVALYGTAPESPTKPLSEFRLVASASPGLTIGALKDHCGRDCLLVACSGAEETTTAEITLRQVSAVVWRYRPWGPNWEPLAVRQEGELTHLRVALDPGEAALLIVIP